MPYLTPSSRKLGETTAVSEDGTVTVTNTIAAVNAGETIVVAIGATDADTSQAVTLTSVSDNDGNTWQTPANARATADYVPNAGLAFAYNVNAQAQSALTVTLTLAEADGGADGVSVNVALLALVNVEDGSNPLDVIVEGEGTGALYTETTPTGPLDQDTSIAVDVSAGWYGDPNSTGGSANILKVQNGSGPGYVGTLVETRVLSGTGSTVGRVDHPDAATVGVSMLRAVFKAKSSGSIRIKLLADPLTLTTAEKPFDVSLWRNGTQEQVLARRFTVADVTSAGRIDLEGADIPYSNLSTSDTIKAYVVGQTRWTGIFDAVVETF